MEMTDSKKTMIWSLCAALCVALPQIVRIIPGADIVYRAMYLPVLLCGAVCGPWGGVFCAFTGTCVAAVISGSPTVVLFPVVLTELIVMGFASGVLMRRKSGPVRGILLAVFLGMIAGGFVAAALFSPGRGSMVLWVWAYVMLGIPAIVVQLVLMLHSTLNLMIKQKQIMAILKQFQVQQLQQTVIKQQFQRYLKQ